MRFSLGGLALSPGVITSTSPLNLSRKVWLQDPFLIMKHKRENRRHCSSLGSDEPGVCGIWQLGAALLLQHCTEAGPHTPNPVPQGKQRG